MILTFRKYETLLRVLTALLPLVAFAAVIPFATGFSIPSLRDPAYDELPHVILLTTLFWAAVGSRYKLFSVERLLHQRTSLISSSGSVAATYGLIGLALFMVHDDDTSRTMIAASAAVLLLANVALRAVFRVVIRRSSGRRHPLRVLMVGTDGFARRAARRLAANVFTPCTVVAYVRVPGESVLVQGKVYEFADVENVDPNNIDDVVLAVPLHHSAKVQEIIGALDGLCRPIRAIVDIGSHLVIREKLFQIGRMQLLDVSTTPVDSLAYRVFKRAFDIAFATFALVATAPLMLLITIAIKLSSPGPVLFRQERVGLNGQLFGMLKFRTMRQAPKNESDVTWTVENDPRRTVVGTFLRKTSLDELPQFFNVLMGDMSVVGPRPERPHFVKKFRHEFDRYRLRHLAKVGITGWAQVNGLRGDTSISKRVDYDIFYLQNWSMLFDLRIILMTLISGLRNKNAY